MQRKSAPASCYHVLYLFDHERFSQVIITMSGGFRWKYESFDPKCDAIYPWIEKTGNLRSLCCAAVTQPVLATESIMRFSLMYDESGNCVWSMAWSTHCSSPSESYPKVQYARHAKCSCLSLDIGPKWDDELSAICIPSPHSCQIKYTQIWT